MNYKDLDFKNGELKTNHLSKVITLKNSIKKNIIDINLDVSDCILWLHFPKVFSIDSHFSNRTTSFSIRQFEYIKPIDSHRDNDDLYDYKLINSYHDFKNIKEYLNRLQYTINYNYKLYKTLKAFS
jgi:hypothetical protein